MQLNLNDTEVVDFGEKAIARTWGVLFTPSMMFMSESVPQGQSTAEAAVALKPGSIACKQSGV